MGHGHVRAIFADSACRNVKIMGSLLSGLQVALKEISEPSRCTTFRFLARPA